MRPLDLAGNLRIPMLMELVTSMHQFAEPHELMEKFIATLRRAYGARCYVQLTTTGLRPGAFRVNRLLTRDGRDLINAHLAEQPVQHGGILTQIIGSSQPSIWHHLDLADDPVINGVVGRCTSAMAAPLLQNEMGIDWVIVFDDEPEAFSEKELEETLLRANLVAAMVNNLETARKLIGASIKIQGEIEQIARIQRALLPEELPQIPGLKLAASYTTFDRAGGDLYDVALLGERTGSQGERDDRCAILIGDVSGHGPAAAVVMAMFHAILHAYPFKPKGPGEVLTHVNRHLCAKRIDNSFVTAVLAFYDPVTRELTYARAGHDPPMLKDFPHKGPPVHLDAVGELPLGIMADVEYREATVQLKSGQTLILYTDGITESRRNGFDLFGVKGIEDALTACSGAAECAVQHITQAVLDHTKDFRPNDDQTVLAVQVL